MLIDENQIGEPAHEFGYKPVVLAVMEFISACNMEFNNTLIFRIRNGFNE